MQRVSIYLRVSKEEQVRGGISLTVQENDCRKRAELLGATDVRIYRDEGMSGRVFERPGLQHLLADLGHTNIVVVWRLDRITRSMRDLAEILDALGAHNVGLVSVTEKLDMTGAAGRLMINILGVLNQFFLELLQENIIAAQAARAEQGLHHGKLPYGYIPSGERQPPAVDPEAAAFVNELFRRYADGQTLSSIRRWADQAQPRRNGKLWGLTTLRKMLANEFYTGKTIWHGEAIDGLHEPLVSSQLFASVQERVQRQRALHPKSRNSSFAAVLRCGVCGGRMTTSSGKYGGNYCCDRQRLFPASERTHRQFVRRDKVDAAVWETTKRVIAGLGDLPAPEPETGPLAQLREEEARLSAEIARMVRRSARADVPDDIVEREAAPLVVALGEVRAKIEKHLKHVEADKAAHEVMRRELPTGLSKSQQLETLVSIYEMIVVYTADDGALLEFHLRSPKVVLHHKLPKFWFRRTGIAGLGFD